MGVVVRPRPDKSFDGKSFSERVLKNVDFEKLRTHTNFLDTVLINQQLKTGYWKELYVEGMKVTELCKEILMAYNLDQVTCKRLEVLYISHTSNGNPKTVVLTIGDTFT